MGVQLQKLAHPVPARYVSPPAQGKRGDFVSHDIITQILLGIVGPFSFKVEQVITNPDGLVDGCTAALTVNVDGREVTVTEAGDCEFPENRKTQGDRLKNAASDALKRCAMRLGLGLHLWSKGDYFLYEQLMKVSASDEASATAGRAQPSGEAASAPASPQPLVPHPGLKDRPIIPAAPETSKARRDRAKARCVALQADGISIADEREARGLPLVDSCNKEQLTLFEVMLTELEERLAAPFVDAS